MVSAVSWGGGGAGGVWFTCWVLTMTLWGSNLIPISEINKLRQGRSECDLLMAGQQQS